MSLNNSFTHQQFCTYHSEMVASYNVLEKFGYLSPLCTLTIPPCAHFNFRFHGSHQPWAQQPYQSMSLLCSLTNMQWVE